MRIHNNNIRVRSLLPRVYFETCPLRIAYYRNWTVKRCIYLFAANVFLSVLRSLFTCHKMEKKTPDHRHASY